jgi:hypothetical protein
MGTNGFVLTLLLVGAIVPRPLVGQQPIAPYDPAARMAVDSLQSDFRVLRQSLEYAHAGLYRYTSRATMESVFDRAYRSINRPMTDGAFFGLVTSVLSAIKDGHTSAVAARPRADFLKRVRVLPIRVRYAKGKPYVAGTMQTALPLGCELLAIDGRGMQSIRDSIFRHLSADGDVVIGKYWKLNEEFRYLYYIYVAQPESAAVTCRTPAGVHTWRVPTVLRADLRTHLDSIAPDRIEAAKPPLRIEPLPLPRATRLVLSSFAGNQDIGAFLDTAFRAIKAESITDLVVDLRGNDGGETAGPALFSYLTSQDFRFVDRIETRTNSLSRLAAYTHLDTAFARAFEQSLVPCGAGGYCVREDADSLLGMYRPAPDHYDGRLWVLTDGETFSNGAAAAIPMRSQHRGTFVGEETGGAYHGYTAGNLIVITPPASGVRVVIPLQAYFMASRDSSSSDRGIIPDYPAGTPIADVLAGTDRQLAVVIRLIQGTRRQ